MKPYKIAMPVYAESDAEAAELEAELRRAVLEYYDEGVYPRASKLTNAVRKYKHNPFLENFLR